jgi:two-component system response regulator MprA
MELPATASPIGATDLEPLTVLLVDDEQDVLRALSELLESEGYKVVTATDGRDALERLHGGLRPDVILLDLMMPGMDGWDFRQEQLKDDDLGSIPVIVISAAGLSRATVKDQLGDVDFLPKPPAVQALLDAIGRRAGGSTH